MGQPFASRVLGQHPGPFLQDECDNQMFSDVPQNPPGGQVCVYLGMEGCTLCCAVVSAPSLFFGYWLVWLHFHSSVGEIPGVWGLEGPWPGCGSEHCPHHPDLVP